MLPMVSAKLTNGHSVLPSSRRDGKLVWEGQDDTIFEVSVNITINIEDTGKYLVACHVDGINCGYEYALTCPGQHTFCFNGFNASNDGSERRHFAFGVTNMVASFQSQTNETGVIKIMLYEAYQSKIQQSGHLDPLLALQKTKDVAEKPGCKFFEHQRLCATAGNKFSSTPFQAGVKLSLTHDVTPCATVVLHYDDGTFIHMRNCTTSSPTASCTATRSPRSRSPPSRTPRRVARKQNVS